MVDESKEGEWLEVRGKVSDSKKEVDDLKDEAPLPLSPIRWRMLSVAVTILGEDNVTIVANLVEDCVPNIKKEAMWHY